MVSECTAEQARAPASDATSALAAASAVPARTRRIHTWFTLAKACHRMKSSASNASGPRSIM